MEIVILHFTATLLMTGAIWLAQLSQYPLLALVGQEGFVRYEQEHIRRISFIAWTVMGIELATGVFLVVHAPAGIPMAARIVGLLLLAIIWANTWFLQYPLHKRLTSGFDAALHRKLVRTNWVRTIAWTARGLLWLFIILSLL